MPFSSEEVNLPLFFVSGAVFSSIIDFFFIFLSAPHGTSKSDALMSELLLFIFSLVKVFPFYFELLKIFFALLTSFELLFYFYFQP